ncbi:MAG: hypothetical protein JXR56_02740, partial [Candidatus Cloacimonetes bacterium]|nr:hypothetical protein [Candidatus Cloacimonadota bacterium]
MTNKMLNEKGSLSIAIVIAIIAVLSSVAMAILSSSDASLLSLQYDATQETHFLRSELERGLLAVRQLGSVSGVLYFPERRAQLNGTQHRRSYYLKTKVEPKTLHAIDQQTLENGYVVKSLIRAKRGAITGFLDTSTMSSIQRYGEADLKQMSFAGYHYFSDNEMSTNNTEVRFWGEDVIHGRCHSNSDIYIESGGNNEYNGIWPCFFGKVSTTGHFQWPDGQGPADLIFRAGFEEEVGELIFNPTADDIRNYGQTIYTGSGPTSTIFAVEVTGSAWNAMVGNITTTGIDSMWHYTVDPGGYIVIDSTVYNVRTIKDTIWTSGGSGSIAGTAGMVYNAKLWIKGSFGGQQTWACEDTLFLIGDIKLAGTNLGEAPDEDTPNLSDYVGIVSEKSIEIKYGYCDPFQSPNGAGFYPRVRPNCE